MPVDPETPQALREFADFQRTLFKHAPKKLNELRQIGLKMKALTATKRTK